MQSSKLDLCKVQKALKERAKLFFCNNCIFSAIAVFEIDTLKLQFDV